MTKAKAPTLAERVARLEEATGLRTTAAPPPDKPECLLYGKPATIKSVVEMYEIEAKARKKLEAELADTTMKLGWAKTDSAYHDRVLVDARRQRDVLQAEVEALRKFVPKAGTAVPSAAVDALSWPSAVSYAGLSGLLLGALAGGLLL